jgi:DNA (cytosine-5)-methyltransferase 1
LKLLSLFDGSGAFVLAAQKLGIKGRYASEIEPFPIAVTRKHFPGMEHLGDIKSINGGDIEPCELVVFGSPCVGYPDEKKTPRKDSG